MSEPEQNMWYPGPDYKGREGDYALTISECGVEKVIELVRERATQDFAWIMEHGLASDSEERLLKMKAWVSDRTHITQCFDANLQFDPTVDKICRELAEITHRLGRRNG